MPSTFKHIGPFYEYGPVGNYIDLLTNRDPRMETLGWDAHSLADSAACFFTGIYPLDAPYFWSGEGIYLAWHDDYWKGSTPDAAHRYQSKKCRKEVAIIAKELKREIALNSDKNLFLYTYMSEHLCSEPKLKVQGLAVEAMLHIDRFVDCLLTGDTLNSITSINAAHRCIIEATVATQLILGIASKNARAAAMIRHKEHHAMKNQVFDYYKSNQGKFKSLDSAAEAIAGKIVPVAFRTVRAWLADYRKSIPSARKP